MKLNELIKKYKKLEGVWNAEGAELARQIFLQDLEQLDKPKPVKELNNFTQAWRAIPDNYIEISEKFNVDIKIFTFEQGLEFTQEIEISKGKILKDIVLKYGDYRWEVAFSNLGG
ncbi:TPA: hypothetical protein ACQXHP_000841 [Streptococcus pneumoniae]